MQGGARRLAVELGLAGIPHAGLAGERIDPPEAGVVTGVVVLGADVAQTDDETDGGHGCERARAQAGPP